MLDPKYADAKGRKTRRTHCPPCVRAMKHESRRRSRHRQAGGPPPPRCEVCGFRFGNSTKGALPAYDHNHGTGLFRGWICQRCNVALGMAGDNPLILDKLAVYLRVRGCCPTRTPESQ